MSTLIAVGLFVVGLALVLFCAEQLVKGVVGTSLSFGLSAFLITTIFIGFDPDNLSVGASAAFEGQTGIAWGSVIGAAMVAGAFAFGVTALFAPMRFGEVPKRILFVPLLAIILLAMLSLDGQLSRADGVILLIGFGLTLVWLMRLSRRGLDIKPTGEVAESLAKAQRFSRWQSVAVLLASLVGIIIGSELLVRASETIIGRLGLSDTFFGMTVLAFLVSIEELARELPAALRGRPDISFGNVVGSTLAMFLFNAGFIALVNPISVPSQVLRFYLPYCFATVLVIALFMATRHIRRWMGGVLVLLYLGFVIGGYVVQ